MGFFREALSNDAQERARRQRDRRRSSSPTPSSRSSRPAGARRRSSSTASTSGSGSSTAWRRPDGVMVSPALASEVGGKEGDVLLTRLQKPSEVPIESLFGRKEDVGRTVRLTLAGVLPRDRLGEFSVKPQQADVRAVFAPLQASAARSRGARPGQHRSSCQAGNGPTRRLRVRAAARRSRRAGRDSRQSARRRHRERQRHRQRGARDRCAQAPSAGWACSRFPSSPIWRTRSARAIGRSRTRS